MDTAGDGELRALALAARVGDRELVADAALQEALSGLSGDIMVAARPRRRLRMPGLGRNGMVLVAAVATAATTRGSGCTGSPATCWPTTVAGTPGADGWPPGSDRN